MKNERTQNTTTEPIIIADECGDTLWDEVLQQEVKACETQAGSPNTALLLRNLATDAVVDLVKNKIPCQDHSEPSLLPMP